MPIECAAVLDELRGLADPANVAGMARFGINRRGALGVSIPTLRELTSDAVLARLA